MNSPIHSNNSINISTIQQQNQPKKWIFYDTSFSRNNVLAMVKLQNDKQMFRKYIEQTILTQWDQKNASHDRNKVFLDFIEHLWRFTVQQIFTVEQKSSILSLAFYLFVESLEKKMTQIESFQIMQQALQSQTLVTNQQNLPIFKQENTQKIEQFFKDYFYRYYSLYEITMTKFIDLNIFTMNKMTPYYLPQTEKLELHDSQVDPQQISLLQEYFFNELDEDLEDEDEEVNDLEDQQEVQSQQQDSFINENNNNVLNGISNENEQQQFMNSLKEEDRKILTYTEDKINDFNKTLKQRQEEQEEQLQEEIEKIMNPKKK